MSPQDERITFSLSADLALAIARKSFELDMSKSEFIRECIVIAASKVEKKPSDADRIWGKDTTD